MKTVGASSSRSAWSTAAVIVAIVAVGTVVAGLLNEPQTDLVAIPGCNEVIQPEELHRVNFAFIVDESEDNPDTRWFSEAKAAAMSNALAGALPTGSMVESDSLSTPLRFGPIDTAVEGSSFGGGTTAHGTILLSGESADVTVTVQKSNEPAGPCFAGSVDERRKVDAGTVVDISDGETRRRVIAYTDDSRIDASADGALTVEQLIDIATIRGLRVSDPVSFKIPGVVGN